MTHSELCSLASMVYRARRCLAAAESAANTATRDWLQDRDGPTWDLDRAEDVVRIARVRLELLEAVRAVLPEAPEIGS
jgi:hypothetical protein